MLRNKIKANFAITLIILLSFLNFKTTFAQEIAELEGVSPNTGSIGEEVNLQLRGYGFDNLGELVSVRISGQEIELRGYRLVSNQLIEVLIWIPEQTPVGQTEIRFIFDDKTVMDAFFIVTEPGDREETRRTEEPREPRPPGEPVLWGLTPNEGEAGNDIDLVLDGENLNHLGELIGISIREVEITVRHYEIESNESLVISAYLPENTPRGGQIIAILFENAGIKEDFFVREPSGPVFPPEILVIVGIIAAVGIVAVTGGVVVARALRKPRPQKKTGEERPTQPRMAIRFNVEVDIGKQSIERTDSNQTRESR